MPDPCPPETTTHLTIVHLNDMHEVIPMAGGKVGGLARAVTLRAQLQAHNPHTILTFAGDLYAPSVFSTAVIAGQPLAGKHAVAAMNLADVTYMTLGDHEIDLIDASSFDQRLQETTFPLISSNIFRPDGSPFPNVATHDIFTVGAKVRIGIFGLTGQILFPGEVAFQRLDPFQAAATQIDILAPQVDFLIALTHQKLADDIELAQRFPQINLILGGHEHQANRVTDTPAPIYKSDSNARAVYVVEVCFDHTHQPIAIHDHLHTLNQHITPNPVITAEIDTWEKQVYNAFRAQGIYPKRVIAHTNHVLDGLAGHIRSHPTHLSDLVMAAIFQAVPQAELALLCSWLIRLDDIIPAHTDVTEYDILRLFPVVNPATALIEMPGDVLIKTLDIGQSSQGTGFYLLMSQHIQQRDNKQWWVNDDPIAPQRVYRVAVSADFPVDFLGTHNLPVLPIMAEYNSLRHAVIEQLTSSA